MLQNEQSVSENHANFKNFEQPRLLFLYTIVSNQALNT